jgi:hypothetical protein
VVASILVGAESLFCYCIVNVKAQSVSLLSPHPTSCLTLLYALSKEHFFFCFCAHTRVKKKYLLWLPHWQESSNAKHPQLFYEAKIYNALQGGSMYALSSKKFLIVLR